MSPHAESGGEVVGKWWAEMRKVVGKLGVRVGMQGCYERLDIIDMSLVGSIYLRQSCDPVVTESDSIHAPPGPEPFRGQFQHSSNTVPTLIQH